MIILLSPAKTLDYTHDKMGETEPAFVEDTLVLNAALRKKSSKSLQSLMKISEKLAKENVARNTAFQDTFDESNSRASIFAFKGDVYRGLEAESLKKPQLKYLNDHVRILSGLYGILKPLDKMQPYRLEMGTSLKVKRKKNLYDFWGEKLSNHVLEELESHKQKWIVNLASNEYFKAVNHASLQSNIINVGFKEYRDGKLKFVSFNAKRARGLFTRYMAINKVKNRIDLKGFNLEDYQIDTELSDENNLMFTR